MQVHIFCKRNIKVYNFRIKSNEMIKKTCYRMYVYMVSMAQTLPCLLGTIYGITSGTDA